jgi:hypothetical protein
MRADGSSTESVDLWNNSLTVDVPASNNCSAVVFANNIKRAHLLSCYNALEDSNHFGKIVQLDPKIVKRKHLVASPMATEIIGSELL